MDVATRRELLKENLCVREPNYILKQSYKRSLDWDWLGFKMSADVKLNGASEDFTLSVRMARDSAIWMSLSPALGVEVARILLTLIRLI